MEPTVRGGDLKEQRRLGKMIKNIFFIYVFRSLSEAEQSCSWRCFARQRPRLNNTHTHPENAKHAGWLRRKFIIFHSSSCSWPPTKPEKSASSRVKFRDLSENLFIHHSKMYGSELKTHLRRSQTIISSVSIPLWAWKARLDAAIQ